MPSTLFHGDLATSKRILYTPSNFAKASLLYLQEIGELEANQPHVSRRQDLDSYLLMIVEKGWGTLTYRGETIRMAPGDCAFIDCRPGYSHATSDDLWSLKWIHFYGPAMGRLYGKYLSRGGRNCFHPNNIETLESIWAKLYESADSADLIREMRINEGLAALLTHLMELSICADDPMPESGGKKDIRSIQAYLDAHFQEKLSLEQVAGEFFMNKYYLAHVFKENVGLTVMEYIQYKRVAQAKQLLRFTNKTVEEISRECGIEDPNYFSRIFRKIEGVPPAKYRRIWIN